MNACDQLIEDILDVAVLSLQTAKTQEGRREIYALMMYIKGKRSQERVTEMERHSMTSAVGDG